MCVWVRHWRKRAFSVSEEPPKMRSSNHGVWGDSRGTGLAKIFLTEREWLQNRPQQATAPWSSEPPFPRQGGMTTSLTCVGLGLRELYPLFSTGRVACVVVETLPSYTAFFMFMCVASLHVCARVSR